MKVIDLLNKIANDEEIPNKIKFLNDIFKYDKGVDYVNSDDQFLFGKVIPVSKEGLNKEVEIIEDKKIEKIFHCNISTSNKEIEFLQENINQLGDKINEIIDEINKKKEGK